MARASPRGRAGHASHVARVEQQAAAGGLVPGRGLTTAEVAKRFRVSARKVRQWIEGGKLRAVNTADVSCAKPRFVILPEHLAEFERSRSTAPPPKPPRRKRSTGIDFYPDL